MAHLHRGRRKPQQLEPLQIALRDPRRLIENPRNARNHSQKQLSQIQASIRSFGFTNPILVDQKDQIIAGHARCAAAIALGLAKVPVIPIVGLGETAQRALALADNKLALNAGWNIEILTQELTFLTDAIADFDVSITGFDTVEIDNLLSPVAESDPYANDDVCPAPLNAAVSRLGDRWILGSHIVVCGDALDVSTYTALLGKERARMAFLDAPYNVKIGGHVSGLGRKRHREFSMASGELSGSAFTGFLGQALTLTAKHCVNGAIIFECMDWRHMPELLAGGRAARLELKNLIVWDKTNASMGTFYRSEHELIFVFKSGSKPHINNFGLGERGRYRTNVWKYPGCNTFPTCSADRTRPRVCRCRRSALANTYQTGSSSFFDQTYIRTDHRRAEAIMPKKWQSGVGYKNPPKYSQFPKGHSGNPTGRPKESMNVGQTIHSALRRRIVVTINGRRRSMTMAEAAAHQAVNRAMRGDPAAIKLVIQLTREAENWAAATDERKPMVLVLRGDDAKL
jgi:hypothetical protein